MYDKGHFEAKYHKIRDIKDDKIRDYMLSLASFIERRARAGECTNMAATLLCLRDAIVDLENES